MLWNLVVYAEMTFCDMAACRDGWVLTWQWVHWSNTLAHCTLDTCQISTIHILASRNLNCVKWLHQLCWNWVTWDKPTVIIDIMKESDFLNWGYDLFTHNFYTKPAEALLWELCWQALHATLTGVPVIIPKKLNIVECLDCHYKERIGSLLLGIRNPRQS